MDRILRIDDKNIDEVCLDDVGVHIEQLDDRCWSIIMLKSREVDAPFFQGCFVADKRGRMRFVEYETVGIEWERDETHLTEAQVRAQGGE